MIKLKSLLICFVALFNSFNGVGQLDLMVVFEPAWTNPQSGCNLGDVNDTIRFVVFNDGTDPAPIGTNTELTFVVGTDTITELFPGGISPNASLAHSFTSFYPDLSACDDTILITTWISHPLDVNPNNDTLRYDFVNSCSITPGDISGGTTVCQSLNSGTLSHGNYANGWVHDWQYWDANVGTWTGLNDTLDTYDWNNLLYETYYRVIRESAFCPWDTSAYDTVFIDSVSIAGITSGSATVCTGTNNGWIYSNGVYGLIDEWQIYDGMNWVSTPSSDSIEYVNLTQPGVYRYIVTNGVCPSDTSDTAFVAIDQLTNPGLLLEDDTLCSGPNSDTLYLTGSNGLILDWEIDSTGTWTSIGVTDTFLVISNMSLDSYFRVILQNGVCPSDTSNSISMIIQNAPTILMCPDTTIVEGDSAQLCATGGAVWVWTPGATLSDSLAQNPMAGPIVQTDYIYTAMSTNMCLNWDTMTVFVEPPVPDEDSIMITNLITANGDGINDTWAITDVDQLIGTQVKIWNVYGQEIYSNDAYQNDWNGTFKGKPLPNGTYFYWVRLGVYNTERKGTITIVGDE